MYYIGVHSTDNIQDDYMGSGSYIRADMQLYGIENFTKEVLFDFKTRKEAFIKESELVTKKEIESNKCYNIILGGGNPIFSFQTSRKSFNKNPVNPVKKVQIKKLSLTILRRFRKEKGMKLKDIAHSVNISLAYLSLIERDKKSPNIEIIENM